MEYKPFDLSEVGGTLEAVFHTVAADGAETDYTRRFRPPQRLILLGGGHIAYCLCRYASELDFDAVVADDRPSFANTARFPDASLVVCKPFPEAIAGLHLSAHDYAAVITRGHTHDGDCLRAIFSGTMPLYLGLIGSRRRTSELFRLLESEGFDPALIRRVKTPIGLPIGGDTPKEIAVSILAELIQVRNSRSEDAAENCLEQSTGDPELQKCLSERRADCAVAVVVEKRGSVPAPTGAVMAVDTVGKTIGTVGGGCGEHEVIMAALNVLRTGRARMLTVDMTNDIAEEEGMVCGGKMKVWVEPLSFMRNG